MYDVAIVGAGELGGNLAHLLARRDVVGSICLIDAAGAVAAGKALDILQASPIEQFSTRVTGATDLSYSAGAHVVVIADRAGQKEWQGDDALLVLKQIAEYSRGAIVVCAGASQRDVVDRGVREHKHSPRRLLGSAPEALAAALKSLIALETGGSTRDVALTVLGVPPHHTVVPWQTVTIGGFSAVDVMSEPVRRRIETRIAPLWPPGPHALAHAAVEAVASIRVASERSFSCFVASADTTGDNQRAAAMPVRLGPFGVVRMKLPELDPRARVALETAMRL